MKLFLAAFCTLFLLSEQAYSACLEQDAVSATKADRAIVGFCSREINGVKRGCSYKARPPSQANKEEREDLELAWIVTASQIFSFDKGGAPLTGPEGIAFAKVSKACKVTSTLFPSP